MSPMLPREILMPAQIELPQYFYRDREGIRLNFRAVDREDFERMIDLSKRLNTARPDNVVIEVIADIPEEEYYLIGRLQQIYQDDIFGQIHNPVHLMGQRKMVNRDGSFFINALILKEFGNHPSLLDRFVEFRPFQGLLVDRLNVEVRSGGEVYVVQATFEPTEVPFHSMFSFVNRLIPKRHRERMGYIDGSNSQPSYFF